MTNHAIIGFNSGILSPKIDTRHDIEKYQRGCRYLQNLIATKYGAAERRGGFKYIDTSYNSEATVRLIEFIYSASVAYKIEMVDGFFRFFYDDAVLRNEADTDDVYITVPYTEDDLFNIQRHQIGDVMWLVNPGTSQRTLSRTDPYTFALDEIDFRKGPFLLRNDLVDLTDTNSSEMSCTATEVGAFGTLTCNAAVFQDGHDGALFKLTHPRTNTIVEQLGQGASSVLSAKGVFTVVSRGTWTGTFYVQRKEFAGEWENHRSYKGTKDRNIIESWEESEDNVEYRINATSMTSAFKADLSTKEGQKYGIVKVTGVGDSFNATCEVYKQLDQTAATKRWAEGAWSGVRGYPSAVTFFEERCVYAGASTGSLGDSTQVIEYPSLVNLAL